MYINYEYLRYKVIIVFLIRFFLYLFFNDGYYRIYCCLGE